MSAAGQKTFEHTALAPRRKEDSRKEQGKKRSQHRQANDQVNTHELAAL